MNVDIVSVPAIPLIMLTHRGPYDGLSSKFDQLWSWIEKHNVPVQRTIGVYWDNADFVPANQLRSAAAWEVASDFQIGDRDGLPVEHGQIQAGNYACVRYVGPYEGLARVWSEMTNHIERKLRRTVLQSPAFEIYVNDPEETPPSQLITDLYMPVV